MESAPKRTKQPNVEVNVHPIDIDLSGSAEIHKIALESSLRGNILRALEKLNVEDAIGQALDPFFIDIVRSFTETRGMTVEEGANQAIAPNFYNGVSRLYDERIASNPDSDHYEILKACLNEYMGKLIELRSRILKQIRLDHEPTFEEVERIANYGLTINYDESKFENNSANLKIVKFIQDLINENDPLINENSIQQLMRDIFFTNYLKFTIGPYDFESGKFEKNNVINAIKETSHFNNVLSDIKFKKGEMYVNDIKEEASNYLYALYESMKNEFEPLDDISMYFDVDDLLESPEEYVSATLKQLRRVRPDFVDLINFKSKFDSVEDEPPKQNDGENDDDDAFAFSQINDDTFDNEGLRSIEKKERASESSSVADHASTDPSTLPLKRGDAFDLVKRQWDLLSAKMTIILNQCSKKFILGRDFINLFLSNSKVLIHSDILDKIVPRLKEIDASVSGLTVPAISVKKQGTEVIQGYAVIQKYSASLEFVALLTNAFEKFKTIYGEALAKNNVEEMDSSVKILSELLQLGAALYSPVHLTHFTIESGDVNNFNRKYTLSTPNVMKEYSLRERGAGVTNYTWLQSVLEKGVGGAKIVSGASTVAAIFAPFAINVSLLSEDHATPLLSLTCAAGIGEKINVLKTVFEESQKIKGNGLLPREAFLNEPLPNLDCDSFESLFFARDGKLGEFLQICILSILKFTTLLQKAGDSQMPIQVGVENLMKKSSSAIDCFMNVYHFVEQWCRTTKSADPWFDNVTKELLSLLFKFIQFYGEHFLINKFTFNKGRENLCPAPQTPMLDRDPDSLGPEAVQLTPTGVAIPLYENPKLGVASYDNYALMMNRGFKSGSYSANLDAATVGINVNKKTLRQQIKSLNETRVQKGGMPPKREKDGSMKPLRPSLEEQTRFLEEQLTQIVSNEKFEKIKAELADDQENFMPVPQAITEDVPLATPPIGELSWDTFKKYMENYIVNFCKEGQPSLKMISFLKMMHLNALMMRLGWGFIDLAGGSLMNFLKRRFVVTADYDSKIYFLTEGIPEEELIVRQTYIKMCMINLGIEINNYMVENEFFGDAKIKAQLSFKPRVVAPGVPPQIPLDLLTVLLELPTGRWFSSRGKEPELFPVPLYSSDMFWSVKLLWVDRTRITPESRIFKSDGVTMSIGYEDLVFKDLNKHFLYKALKGRGETHDDIMRIIYSTFVSPYNFDDADRTFSKMKTSRWFALRIPSLYEIEYDIKSMLQEPELKNARMAVGKNGKDVDRDRLVVTLKSLIGQKNRVAPADISDFFMRYPIASTFADKIRLYFQTDLFGKCCKRVNAGDVNMINAMLLPPLGVITNMTNDVASDVNKNNFLLPPVHIVPIVADVESKKVKAQPTTESLELTQLMRRAVLYSYNTTSKIFMTMVHLTKKYGEFKSKSDFERLRHIQQFDFNVSGSGKIGFELFNYELWVSNKKLQSPIPFENCYFAGLNDARDGLIYNDVGYQSKRDALTGETARLPQFAQLVIGISTPVGAPDPSPSGVVDRMIVADDGVPIKNTTAETIAAKTDRSKLNPLYGDYQRSIRAATEFPLILSTPELFGDNMSKVPISTYGGGSLTRLTKKRTGISSSLLLFTKRNRSRSLKQKKRTIKKSIRKKSKGRKLKTKGLKQRF